MKAISTAATLLLASLFAGCSFLEPYPTPGPIPTAMPAPRYDPASDPQPHYTILVESSPPGVRLEFNDEFVGTTPCRVRISGEAGRKFSHSTAHRHVFKALPPDTGGSTQIKSFSEGSDIPEHLFFDMRLVYQ